MARAPRPEALPLRDGVSASCVAVPAGPWPTLLDFLCERLPAIDRVGWLARLAAGEVLDDTVRPLAAGARPRIGQRIFYFRRVDAEPEPENPAQVLFQDDHLVVADKPHFMPVTPSGRFVRRSLLVQLKQRLGLPDLSPVHRIDRDTAGLVVLATRPQDRDAYQRLFRDRAVHKLYEAVADAPGPGRLWPVLRRSRIIEEEGRFFRMVEAQGEPNSETRIEVAAVDGDLALYRLEPVTGRRHQLRVHMAALGLPLAGDAFYPTVRHGPGEPDDRAHPLQLLARGLRFTDPLTGQERRFRSRMRLAAWPAHADPAYDHEVEFSGP